MTCIPDLYGEIDLAAPCLLTMYRIQSFIELLLGCFSPLSYYNQPIKLKINIPFIPWNTSKIIDGSMFNIITFLHY